MQAFSNTAITANRIKLLVIAPQQFMLPTRARYNPDLPAVSFASIP
jgi:hypothetical protein